MANVHLSIRQAASDCTAYIMDLDSINLFNLGLKTYDIDEMMLESGQLVLKAVKVRGLVKSRSISIRAESVPYTKYLQVGREV